MTPKGLDVWRVSHYKDIAVHYPDKEVKTPFGNYQYQHALREIYYDHKTGSHYTECDVDDNTRAGQWPVIPTPTWLDDHCWFADMNPCTCSASSSGSESVLV